MICAAGVDLPAVKLRAVRVRHAFGLLHQQQGDEMQARHEAEAEAMLKSYTDKLVAHGARRTRLVHAYPQCNNVCFRHEQLRLPL